jgi:hypothetical protein
MPRRSIGAPASFPMHRAELRQSEGSFAVCAQTTDTDRIYQSRQRPARIVLPYGAFVFSDHCFRNYSLDHRRSTPYFEGVHRAGKRQARPQHGSKFRRWSMKNRFIALGFVLLLAALGFALDLGITATLLRF